jgi:imidazolonepropionase-like amidohydrolase
VIQNGTLLFDNGKITAVGRNVTVPANAERVDVTGRHIYPGLVEAAGEIGLTEIGGFDVAVDQDELGEFTPNVRAHVAVNPESRHIGVARSNGVLVTVSSPNGGTIAGLASAMMLDGWTWEQMTLKPEVGMVIEWPSTGNRYDEVIGQLRDFFATARAYHTARTAAAQRHETDSRLEAMIPVLERRIPVIVSADDTRQIQDAVTWAKEENVRIVIRGARDAGYVAEFLAREQVPVLLGSVLDAPDRDWEPYDGAYSLPARLHAAGVKFGITGGGNAAYANRLPYEAGAAIAFGLPADEALKAVTLYPAQFLGIGDRVGSLEVGKDASFIIATGSPLEYASIVEQVYIEGRKADMNDAHRAFFEKYSQKLKQVGPIKP